MKKFLLTVMTALMFLTAFQAKAEELKVRQRAIVAYFSATGTTALVAERLSQAIGVDLFEIEPAKRYSADDLNWKDKLSRSSIEMSDPKSRPAIKSKIADMAQYDLVFVGFPIWWHKEPSIIDTFMEAYDFSDKTVVPFVTSGGSGIGTIGKNLQELAPKATVAEGRRFTIGVTVQELRNWANEWLYVKWEPGKEKVEKKTDEKETIEKTAGGKEATEKTANEKDKVTEKAKK